MRKKGKQMLRSIPPKTSTGRPRNRKSTITKIPLNLRLPSFGNIRRSVTKNSESFGHVVKKGKKMGMIPYQQQSTKALEELLALGNEERDKLEIIIQAFPSDENQIKFEKLGLIIDRLKYQIEGRK